LCYYITTGKEQIAKGIYASAKTMLYYVLYVNTKFGSVQCVYGTVAGLM